MSQVVMKPFAAMDLMAVFAAAIEAEETRCDQFPCSLRPHPPPSVDKLPDPRPIPASQETKGHQPIGSMAKAGSE